MDLASVLCICQRFKADWPEYPVRAVYSGQRHAEAVLVLKSQLLVSCVIVAWAVVPAQDTIPGVVRVAVWVPEMLNSIVVDFPGSLAHSRVVPGGDTLADMVAVEGIAVALAKHSQSQPYCLQWD